MGRKIRVAAIQMDAVPAPTSARLERAAKLISEAVQKQAQVLVLPELFNTGYQYDNQNYELAETLDGQTMTWMRQQASEQQIYLAGTFMLREGDEIYNSAFLIAPNGQTWRYDKKFPWLWERTYFRDGQTTEIAHTELGDFGMLICWDSAHPELWAHYAGQVDALLVMSCPPKMSTPDLVFPDGKRVPQHELGGMYSVIHTDEEHFPGVDMDEQTAWLNVPVVATVGAGKVRLKLPRPYLAMSNFTLFRPDLWLRWRQFKDLYLETGFDKQTKIINAQGQVMSRLEKDGDGVTISEIELADKKAVPQGQQPKMRTHKIIYFLADTFASWVLAGQYRKQARRK